MERKPGWQKSPRAKMVQKYTQTGTQLSISESKLLIMVLNHAQIGTIFALVRKQVTISSPTLPNGSNSVFLAMRIKDSRCNIPESQSVYRSESKLFDTKLEV